MKKSLLIVLTLMLCSVAANTQTCPSENMACSNMERTTAIRFKWNVFFDFPTYKNNFFIRAANGKKFTVDWGDGTATTYTGRGDDPADRDSTNTNTYINAVKIYNDYKEYAVTVFSTDADCEFTAFHASHKKIISLDVSEAKELEYLNCELNDVTTIDVSQNPALTHLNVFWNHYLTRLNVTGATALRYLECAASKLTMLDVSQNPALTYLDCEGNQLDSLNVSNNRLLEKLFCNQNNLTSLDISNNSKLSRIWYFENKLSLKDLYSASCATNVPSNKLLGTQTLDTLIASKGIKQPITPDTAFGSPAVATTYANFKYNGDGAIEGLHYVKNGHYITFIDTGVFEIEAKNTSIISHDGYSAKVVYTYKVSQSMEPPRILALSLTDGAMMDKLFNPDNTTYNVEMSCSRNSVFRFTINELDTIWINDEFYMGSVDIPIEREEGTQTKLLVRVSNAFGTREYSYNLLTPYDSNRIIQPYSNMFEVVNNPTLFGGGPMFMGNGNYQWYRDGRPIIGAVNGVLCISRENSFMISSYSVEVTHLDGSKHKVCAVTSEVEEIHGMQVSPNPTCGDLKITNGFLNEINGQTASKKISSLRIEVFSMDGRLVGVFPATDKHTDINISHLPKGMYIIRSGNESATIVKQ